MFVVVVLKIKKNLLFYYLEYILMNLFEFKYSVKMINRIGKNINGLINCKYLNGFVIMKILKLIIVYKGIIVI